MEDIKIGNDISINVVLVDYADVITDTYKIKDIAPVLINTDANLDVDKSFHDFPNFYHRSKYTSDWCNYPTYNVDPMKPMLIEKEHRLNWVDQLIHKNFRISDNFLLLLTGHEYLYTDYELDSTNGIVKMNIKADELIHPGKYSLILLLLMDNGDSTENPLSTMLLNFTEIFELTVDKTGSNTIGSYSITLRGALKDITSIDAKGEDGEDGEDAYHMEIYTDTGNIIMSYNTEVTMSAHMYKGSTDITDSAANTYFSWTRVTSDSTADAKWNAQHAGVKSIKVSYADLILRKAMFECNFNLESYLKNN